MKVREVGEQGTVIPFAAFPSVIHTQAAALID